jgi:hypothetical protein
LFVLITVGELRVEGRAEREVDMGPMPVINVN